jgi:hypothetical protein
MSEDDPICVLEHKTDPDRPRRAWTGYLCRGHSEGLWRVLSELADFAGQADQASYDETVSIGTGQPTTGTKEQPLPIADQSNPKGGEDKSRIGHTIKIRGVLASWCILVAEERGVAVPTSPEPRITSGFLRLHLDWACGQTWIDEMAAEVFDLGQRAFSLLNPSGVRRIAVGPCRELVEAEDGKLSVCGGQITALVRKSDDLLPSSIRCNACGVEVTADRWLTYGRQIREDAA